MQITSGADETTALADGSTTDVYLRVGSVVAYVHAVETEIGNVNHAATHQVGRIKNAA